MAHKIFSCENFKNFLRNSKIGMENNIYGIDVLEQPHKPYDKPCSTEQKIINNLDILTKEDKILWLKDLKGVFKGVIIENCTFSEYRILIKKDFLTPEEILKYKVGYLSEKYKIFLLKGVAAFEKIEYISNPDDQKVDFACSLINSIEKKILQQLN
jgi:hypothetical protein